VVSGVDPRHWRTTGIGSLNDCPGAPRALFLLAVPDRDEHVAESEYPPPRRFIALVASDLCLVVTPVKILLRRRDNFSATRVLQPSVEFFFGFTRAEVIFEMLGIEGQHNVNFSRVSGNRNFCDETIGPLG
jgi:hypothetical protein